ncbi:DUF6397 family protein [Streptomyces polyrhachis]|uniref:DUF6397 family protein n=1 Tax=Streptomyces polyrhachis TaxID=1282885 RepID=A0ABW2GJ70_9ACTN
MTEQTVRGSGRLEPRAGQRAEQRTERRGRTRPLSAGPGGRPPGRAEAPERPGAGSRRSAAVVGRSVGSARCRPPGGPEAVVPLARAAVELGLKPRELEVAVQLGAVRSTAGAHGRRRVPWAEIDRVRSEAGYPEALRAQLRLVGTLEGARLLGIGAARFARLARAGCFAPMRFSVNRYRAVVWLYLAQELEEFAEREPELLRDCTPEGVRALVADGGDWRPRLWRERTVRWLLAGEAAQEDPWSRAAVQAAVLPDAEVAELVVDGAERARLAELRPESLTARSSSPEARLVAAAVLRAEQADEVLRYRVGLSLALSEARAADGLAPPSAALCGASPERARGLLRRLGLRPGAAR